MAATTTYKGTAATNAQGGPCWIESLRVGDVVVVRGSGCGRIIDTDAAALAVAVVTAHDDIPRDDVLTVRLLRCKATTRLRAPTPAARIHELLATLAADQAAPPRSGYAWRNRTGHDDNDYRPQDRKPLLDTPVEWVELLRQYAATARSAKNDTLLYSMLDSARELCVALAGELCGGDTEGYAEAYALVQRHFEASCQVHAGLPR